MTEFTQQLGRAALATSPWEMLAVLLAIAYLLLAIARNNWCWAAALVSTGIYLVLMYHARLYMESALQVFYMAMAVYGWRQWRHGGVDDTELPVTSWGPRRNLFAIGAILAVAAASGALLAAYSDAALPYLDSFTTWGAIVATWLVARKVLENWLYWFVIDGVSVYLYVYRGLYLTALLFAFYLVLIVIGYRAWRRAWVAEAAEPAPA